MKKFHFMTILTVLSSVIFLSRISSVSAQFPVVDMGSIVQAVKGNSQYLQQYEQISASTKGTEGMLGALGDNANTFAEYSEQAQERQAELEERKAQYQEKKEKYEKRKKQIKEAQKKVKETKEKINKGKEMVKDGQNLVKEGKEKVKEAKESVENGLDTAKSYTQRNKGTTSQPDNNPAPSPADEPVNSAPETSVPPTVRQPFGKSNPQPESATLPAAPSDPSVGNGTLPQTLPSPDIREAAAAPTESNPQPESATLPAAPSAPAAGNETLPQTLPVPDTGEAAAAPAESNPQPGPATLPVTFSDTAAAGNDTAAETIQKTGDTLPVTAPRTPDATDVQENAAPSVAVPAEPDNKATAPARRTFRKRPGTRASAGILSVASKQGTETVAFAKKSAAYYSGHTKNMVFVIPDVLAEYCEINAEDAATDGVVEECLKKLMEERASKNNARKEEASNLCQLAIQEYFIANIAEAAKIKAKVSDFEEKTLPKMEKKARKANDVNKNLNVLSLNDTESVKLLSTMMSSYASRVGQDALITFCNTEVSSSRLNDVGDN